MTAMGPLPGSAGVTPVDLRAETVPLLLIGNEQTIVSDEPVEMVATPDSRDLPGTMADILSGGSDRAVGLMPFDTARSTPAYAAAAREGRMPPEPTGTSPAGRLLVRAEPAPEAYLAAVRAATRALAGQPDLRKVVLARSLLVESTAPFDITALVSRLGRASSSLTFCVPLPGALGTVRAIVGATPELLIRKRGRRVLSEPLAGSRARSPDPAIDRSQASALLRSPKDLREHRFVVDAVLDTLAPFCASLRASEPLLASTPSVWHLKTSIEATLRTDRTSAAELAAHLHPTPAVCGTPREAARELIAALEPVNRGFFAGALGWCDRHGDGDWHVVIRCAEISGGIARLFAGAGIVAGSEPEAELAETEAKFATLLAALGTTDTA